GPMLLSGYVGPAGPPFLEDGWLETGDRGRLDADGNLHVLGRRSDRIVTGGENVDPVEVEQALESLPAVSAACVFGVPDEDWGEVVCAAVVLAPGRRPTASDTAVANGTAATGETGPTDVEADIRGLRGRLAPFKLPRRLAVLDSLPRNPTGKVDREETARRAAGRLRAL
ncbi:MAG: 2-succinylbenzoate--CoA ligase, partial [Gemmatimonadetes bacterium]|nr:long-chain fatty acid--CoA ligase [Gemmatimonadota bacterium]NIQ59906.1 long-chain fatty acid--CoA ligase [Gemmatimonadota bacterium]NIX48519.1 2-succinylbenzoate--CoA ligase [Gemmatimonadota bacterium]NIY12962.1 2-succinylbenzoate--CoA ligase [Gemmatimonadota bacterium]